METKSGKDKGKKNTPKQKTIIPLIQNQIQQIRGPRQKVETNE
jgi:hypothetical protein